MKRSPLQRGPAQAADAISEAPSMRTTTFPTTEALLKTLVSLGSHTGIDSSDRSIAEAYLEAIGRLFPDRAFHIQLLSNDGDTAMRFGIMDGEITSGEGPLRLPRSMVDSTSWKPPRGISAIEWTDEYVPVSETVRDGFHLLLSFERAVDGVLTVEYVGSDEHERDRELLEPVVESLATALRNARTYRRSESLRLHLRQMLEDANAPIVLINRAGIVVFVNRAYSKFTGFSDGEVIGQEMTSTLAPGTSERLIQPLLRALRGEPTAEIELSLRRLDGQVAHVAANTAPVLNRDGVIDGALFIYRDISELRQLEAQVIQSEKLATLGQMAAGIVHELNNPLTSIQVYADYLEQKWRGDGHDVADLRKIERIAQGAARIMRFTRDLITYARPSEDAPVSMSVVDSIEQAIGFCEHIITDRGAHVRRDFPRQMPKLLAIKEQLVQVWVNLITNACHALPERGGELQVAVEQVNDDELAVRIRDNGLGIPESIRSRLFEPFFSTKHEGEGTGLGLSIVKSIIDRHAGRIEVESEAGMGTMFIIYLPIRYSLTAT